MIKRYKTKKFRRMNEGFTLIETLVAISIFSISILAMMAVLAQGISNTNYVKDKVIATYLAQEGIEYMRNLRDTFVLYDPSGNAQAGWNDFKQNLISAPANCQSASGCYIDDRNVDYGAQDRPMINLMVNKCLSALCPESAMLYDSTTGKYGYVSGISSGFSRKVNINLINGGTNEIKISSTVSWIQGSGNYNITFSENLFNWVE